MQAIAAAHVVLAAERGVVVDADAFHLLFDKSTSAKSFDREGFFNHM